MSLQERRKIYEGTLIQKKEDNSWLDSGCPGQVDFVKGQVKENFTCPTVNRTSSLIRKSITKTITEPFH